MRSRCPRASLHLGLTAAGAGMRTILIASAIMLIASQVSAAAREGAQAVASATSQPQITLPRISLHYDATGYRFASKTHKNVARYARGAMRKLKVSDNSPAQPTISFSDADGRATTLMRFRGKVAIVNLWASWCAPCKVEMATLAALQRTYANKDLVVVPISVDRSVADAKSFLADYDSLPLFDDSVFSVPIALGVTGLPTSVIYDRKGREVGRFLGATDWASPEARALVDYLLAMGVDKEHRSPRQAP